MIVRHKGVMQAVLDGQGTGDAGHGRTVERVGDQLRVTFGNGMIPLANLDSVLSRQELSRRENVILPGLTCHRTGFVLCTPRDVGTLSMSKMAE